MLDESEGLYVYEEWILSLGPSYGKVGTMISSLGPHLSLLRL